MLLKKKKLVNTTAADTVNAFVCNFFLLKKYKLKFGMFIAFLKFVF